MAQLQFCQADERIVIMARPRVSKDRLHCLHQPQAHDVFEQAIQPSGPPSFVRLRARTPGVSTASAPDTEQRPGSRTQIRPISPVRSATSARLRPRTGVVASPARSLPRRGCRCAARRRRGCFRGGFPVAGSAAECAPGSSSVLSNRTTNCVSRDDRTASSSRS